MTSFAITRFLSVYDTFPSGEVITWADLVAIFFEARRTLCSQKSCAGDCSHKRGPCWSPVVYAAGCTQRRRDAVVAVSLLVFDIGEATDDQIDEIRDRLSAHRYLMHATHADRPDKRSVRIIVTLSRPVLREEWSLLWEVARQTYAPIADPACSDVSRIYFLPSRPHDADYTVQVNNGDALDVDALLVGDPTEGGNVQ